MNKSIIIKKKVLIVEDEKVYAETLVRHIKDKGEFFASYLFEENITRIGIGVEREVESFRPNLIVSDGLYGEWTVPRDITKKKGIYFIVWSRYCQDAEREGVLAVPKQKGLDALYEVIRKELAK